MNIEQERIIILDFGSQYTQLIARRVRESKVYSEIYPFNISLEKIKKLHPKGIILSGSPSSVYDEQSPRIDAGMYQLGIPILGICYGMQLTTFLLNGEVEPSHMREYGKAELIVDLTDDLFAGFSVHDKIPVWMSHGDRIKSLPPGYEIIGHSVNSPFAAMRNKERNVFGVQFHPEVVHTPRGKDILNNFLFGICKCSSVWTMKSFVQQSITEIRRIVGNNKVICGCSGGVDSTVAAVLLEKAIGQQLTCIFIDNGLLRKHEFTKVSELLTKSFHVNLLAIDASQRFLQKLSGVVDPERKRKIIGHEFIYVFEEEARKLGKVDFLAQGTLYPDVIESVSFKGPSATIKSHHNVGGLPDKMNLKLIEPFRELFKDEVRELGKELGLPDDAIYRHPFPGPGLSIRIIGEITAENLRLVRDADEIILDEFKKSGWYHQVWQAFAVILPIQTVGVMGDERTYEKVIALRVVQSIDAMTADWAKVPYDLLGTISNRIINEIKGINRVVYDISSKPPSTIEWE
jgi:GMP synthase (glutamine-hydrolysing)